MQRELYDKNIVITGGTSGIGKIALFYALSKGANITALCRNNKKAEMLKKEVLNRYPEKAANLQFIEGDLSSLQSTMNFCNSILKLNHYIDQLILNAGVANQKLKVTTDNIEETLQVNVISQYLILHKLNHLLKSDNNSGKIILTASGLHFGKINFDDIEYRKKFSGFKVYKQSKLALILLCRLLAPSLKNKGVSIYAQHPGLVNTNIASESDWFSRLFFKWFGLTPEEGAENLIYLMTSSNQDLKSGEFYYKKKLKKSSSNSYDMEMAEKLKILIENKYLKIK